MAMCGRSGALMMGGGAEEMQMRDVQTGEGERGGEADEVAIGSRSCCGGERLTLLSLWSREIYCRDSSLGTRLELADSPNYYKRR